MKELKVGLDLDGVVYNFEDPFKQLLKYNGVKFDSTEYDFGLSRKDFNKYMKIFSETNPFLWLPIYKNTSKILNQLNGFMDFHIATNRKVYKYAEEDTITRLDMDNIPYKNIMFTDKKADYSKTFNLDLFIEDSLKNARDILRFSSAKVFLIDKPYNQGWEHKNMIRIKGLESLTCTNQVNLRKMK